VRALLAVPDLDVPRQGSGAAVQGGEMTGDAIPSEMHDDEPTADLPRETMRQVVFGVDHETNQEEETHAENH